MFALCSSDTWSFPWTTADLLLSCPGLSLVIDLTNTARYYDWQLRGPTPAPRDGAPAVEYAKVATEGQVIPSRKVVAKFFGLVDGQLARNPGEDRRS